MIALLISAGQGTRLLPHTLETPKCLVRVAGQAILDWQLDAIRQAGIRDVVIVGGYKAEHIERHIARLPEAERPRFVHNPFWSVSSSIGSVWEARAFLRQPFCLMNGDVVVTRGLLADVLRRSPADISLVVEQAPVAEQDDMRVAVEAGRALRVGKDLPAEEAAYRSLGIILCREGGWGAYGRALEAVISGEDGPHRYHHDIVDRLAREGRVAVTEFGAHDWLEIDRPADIASWERRHGSEVG